jgi:hypothetical protein
LIFSLLLVSCHSEDSRLKKQIVGTWAPENSDGFYLFEMTLNSDGSFQSKMKAVSTNPAIEWNYAGSWQIKDGLLLSTITNSSGQNTTNLEPAGSFERWRIAVLDDSNLKLEGRGQTNSFKRK